MSGRVGFLVAGVQKGGTSALFDYLREVPALQLPAIKEAHFFDDEERVNWAAPDYAPYHALFEEDGRLWGEATPITIYWPNALERIRAYNPAMRLILTLRDPVERAWSHWKMEWARGAETEPFAWCIREGRARMATALPYPGFHRVWSYVERGFYARQIEHLLTLFSRSQLLIVRQETLATDPNTIIGRICDFLEVPRPTGSLAPRRVRVARQVGYPSALTAEDVAFLQQLYSEDQARLPLLADDRG